MHHVLLIANAQTAWAACLARQTTSPPCYVRGSVNRRALTPLLGQSLLDPLHILSGAQGQPSPEANSSSRGSTEQASRINQNDAPPHRGPAQDHHQCSPGTTAAAACPQCAHSERSRSSALPVSALGSIPPHSPPSTPPLPLAAHPPSPLQSLPPPLPPPATARRLCAAAVGRGEGRERGAGGMEGGRAPMAPSPSPPTGDIAVAPLGPRAVVV